MSMRALFRVVPVLLCLMAVPLTAIHAQHFSTAAVEMFRDLRQQPNDLARYVYLVNVVQDLSASERPLALQMFAANENELGLYNEALRDFPLKVHQSADDSLPTPADFKSADAVDEITKLTASRQLVLINEAHHDAHTRELTLELLPKLRAQGFNYFAAEALIDKDSALAKRGYPLKSSGTEYLHEPTYGEIVRTALRLGFKVVSYDVDERQQADREAGQAENLYKKVFAHDPNARLFVHAGYAHIDKAKGRLNNILPMAAHLKRLTGIEPFSIDQSQLREQVPRGDDAYDRLILEFKPSEPIVLVNRNNGIVWSQHPTWYDVNVLLPPSAQGSVESGYVQPSTIVHNSVDAGKMFHTIVNTRRPDWLSLQGQRFPVPINTNMCKVTIPCVVDAHYADETNDAVAADRYAFLHASAGTNLYLRPGKYRLRAWDIHDRTLAEQDITVKPR